MIYITLPVILNISSPLRLVDTYRNYAIVDTPYLYVSYMIYEISTDHFHKQHYKVGLRLLVQCSLPFICG